MRTQSNQLTHMLRPALIALAFVATSAGAMNVMARLARPVFRIGDMVHFLPSGEATSDAGTRLLVHRSDQFGCVVNLDVLRQSGGSLLIDGRPAGADGNYRLHWAGRRTSLDSADCGSDAELIVSAGDLRVLTSAADQPVPVAHDRVKVDKAGSPTMR